MTFLRCLASLLFIAIGIVAAVYGVQVLLDFHDPLAGKFTHENSNFFFGVVFLLIGIVAGAQGVFNLIDLIGRHASPRD